MNEFDAKSATADTLFAKERYAGWKPAEIRRDADQIEAGTHPAQAAFAAVPGLVDGLPASMRAEADRIESEGKAATAELARRLKALPAFKGYVS